MPLYSYKALNENGRVIKGCITGANEVDLEHRLQGIGLDLVSCKEAKETKLTMSNRVSIKELIVLCVYLEQLERAGVPILDAITDLRDSSESQRIKNLMSDIYESIKGGSLLSAAMAQHPEVFDEVFTGLIAAGEKTGRLYDVLGHLAHHLKWVNEIRSKVKKATIYPTFLMLMMVGIVTLMMMFVIPKLSTFLKAQNFALPVYTKALIATSEAFKDFWFLLLGLPFCIVFGLIIITKMFDSVAYMMDQVKLSLPVLGSTIRKIEMARFCRFFAITYKSGIGILDCLDIAANVVGNRIIRESIVAARRGVSEGNSLTASLRFSNQFPNLVLRMFKVGEESGNIDMTLENVNFFYDKEVNDAVNGMIALIQPALTIILGGIMLWISIAVFGPLYNSFSKMSF